MYGRWEQRSTRNQEQQRNSRIQQPVLSSGCLRLRASDALLHVLLCSRSGCSVLRTVDHVCTTFRYIEAHEPGSDLTGARLAQRRKEAIFRLAKQAVILPLSLVS
jgi:hypothetical protein